MHFWHSLRRKLDRESESLFMKRCTYVRLTVLNGNNQATRQKVHIAMHWCAFVRKMVKNDSLKHNLARKRKVRLQKAIFCPKFYKTLMSQMLYEGFQGIFETPKTEKFSRLTRKCPKGAHTCAFPMHFRVTLEKATNAHSFPRIFTVFQTVQIYR